MECPKCGAEIDDKAMVCPNCKKVLKIVCPVCRTVNEKNICRKCGEILVTKCENCGKINLMKNQKCIKCGYSTELSALQAESNAETFAVVKIEFPNDDVVKAALGSNQLFSKFKNNLDRMINNYAQSLGVRRQIVKNKIYLLRFNKVYTFSSSANNAIQAVIELANMITRMNVKLLDKKNIALKCNFTLMKRDADKDPYDIDTGFGANMLNQDNDFSAKALDSCQVMTDEDFYDLYKDNYKLDAMDNVMVKGRMKRFFQINIKEFINLNEYLEEIKVAEEDNNFDIPVFVEDGLRAQDINAQRTMEEVHAIAEEAVYSVDLINFDEINCAFYASENVKTIDTVLEVLQDVPRGILALKGANRYQPYTLRLLSSVDELGIYQNVIPITCYDDMKYSPYSFFRELLLSVFDYTVSQKLFSTNDFSIFNGLDSHNLVRDLACLNQRDMVNLEDTRSEYFSVFMSLLKSIPDTLIYIENFEKIDSGSKFVLDLLFEHFDELNISYIISYDKDFSLHKESHFLLSRPYYTEIALLPTKFADIIAANESFYKNIETDFYFKRIAKYAAGSTLFLDYAIQYLIESEVYRVNEANALEMINAKTTMIPSSLGQLIKRRLNLMKDNKDLIKFLAMCVLTGPRIDTKTYDSLDIPDKDAIVQDLAEKGHLFIYNDSIYFPNYNLLKENVLEVIDGEDFNELAKDLFENIYVENMPSPAKAFLYEKTGETQKIIFEWEKLANLDLSMGDFASYLNCSGEIIKSLDKYASEWSDDELQKYKTTIYENIAHNMFEYNPELTRDIADKTLDDLQNSEDKQNFIDLCTKMINGAMDHGEYFYALSLTHKILSVMDKVSIDPTAPNFDMKFLLMSIIHIKILFSIGAFSDCVDVGYNVLNALDSQKLETIQSSLISQEDLKNLLLESIAYIAIADVVSLKEDIKEFLDIVNKLYNFVPKEYEIFIQLQNLIRGEQVNISENLKGNNVFSNICYHIIRAFSICKDKPEDFAREVYKAKIIAKDAYIFNLELLADALIGYSYLQLESYMKASAILYEVVKSSQAKGMNAITYVAWYIMSILNMKTERYDIAYGILKNASIKLEKTGTLSEFITLLNQVNMYKVLTFMNEPEKAAICLNQAQYIVKKYNLNFNLD